MNKDSSYLWVLLLIGALVFGGFSVVNPPAPPSHQPPFTILMYYESTTVDPEFHNQTMTDLRRGELDVKHRILWLDPQNEPRNPSPTIQAAIKEAKSRGEPAIVIVDSQGSVIGSAKINVDWKAEDVLDLVKRNGG